MLVNCDKCNKQICRKKCLLKTYKHHFCSVSCKNKFGHTKETKKRIVLFLTGRKQSKETIEKRRSKNVGRKRTLEQRIRISNAIPKGKRNHFWRGGVTPIRRALRATYKYRWWRNCVFERDNYICQLCKIRGDELEADHITPFSKIIEKIKNTIGEHNLFDNCLNSLELWDINNGRTLCVKCHKKTDTYAKNTAYL
jgi:5-methylcytosine-specific restriction endonuclease McrA